MTCVEDELTDPTALTLSVSRVALGKAQEFGSAKTKEVILSVGYSFGQELQTLIFLEKCFPFTVF